MFVKTTSKIVFEDFNKAKVLVDEKYLWKIMPGKLCINSKELINIKIKGSIKLRKYVTELCEVIRISVSNYRDEIIKLVPTYIKFNKS